jgi:hypothetical protein
MQTMLTALTQKPPFKRISEWVKDGGQIEARCHHPWRVFSMS